MKRQLAIALGLLSPLAVPAPYAARALEVTDWSLLTLVYGNGEDRMWIYEVQNPLVATQHAELGSSTADTQIQCSWDNSSPIGAFFIIGRHVARDSAIEYVHCMSAGELWVRPEANVTLSLSGRYSYSLPPRQFAAYFVASIAEEGRDSISGIYQDVDTLDGRWAVGEVSLSRQVFLPAGLLYRLEYAMKLGSYRGGTEFTGTGEGEIRIEFSPAPPPTYGDMNCNGLVNGGDIGPLLWRLRDEPGYRSFYSACHTSNGDINLDGAVDAQDIPALVELLLGS